MNVNERDILAAFRLRGLSVGVDGMALLLRLLQEAAGRETQLRMLSAVVEQLCSAFPATAVIGADLIETAISALRPAAHADLERLRFVVINAFDAPKLVFDAVRRVYAAEPSPPRSHLHSPAEAKLFYVREHFQLVRQRVLRDPHFFIADQRISATGTAGDRVGLTGIETLIGSSGAHCVLGIVVQTADGDWAIEDLSGRIAIDVANASHTEGMITEGSVVLATGELVDGVLRIDTIGLPPSELRGDAVRAIGPGIDYFGGAPAPALQAQLERDAATSAALVIVLSEVWLDDPIVLQRIRTLLAGFESKSLVPDLFILMGNFTSRPFAGGLDYTAIPPLFDALSAVIQSTPTISRRSRFLLIPGPSDPCGTTVSPLPRMPLPHIFIGQQLTTNLGDRLALGSNPCRLRFCSEEIVLFREEIITKLRRHCLMPCAADTTQQLSRQFVRSICDQGNLCPLPLSVCPVHWSFGHSLSLEPLPHLVVVGDRSEAFVHSYVGCIVVNPGPFARDGTFVAFQPSTRTAEIGNVNNPINSATPTV